MNFSAQKLATESSVLRGVVITTAGDPLEGVTVTCGGHTATTAADGRYTISGLAAGAYEIAAAKDRFFIFGPWLVDIGSGATTANFTARPDGS